MNLRGLVAGVGREAAEVAQRLLRAAVVVGGDGVGEILGAIGRRLDDVVAAAAVGIGVASAPDGVGARARGARADARRCRGDARRRAPDAATPVATLVPSLAVGAVVAGRLVVVARLGLLAAR